MSLIPGSTLVNDIYDLMVGSGVNAYHWRKGAASIWTMADLVKVLVRTNSLLEGWKVTPMTRVFLLILSDPHEKLPESKRSARNFLLPPRVRTIWIPNQFALSVYRPE